MLLLGAFTILAAGCQLGLGLVVPAIESRDTIAGANDKRALINVPAIIPAVVPSPVYGSIPIQKTTSNLWKYSGCQLDLSLSVLSAYTFTSDVMTPDLCTITCSNKGYTFAGVRDKNFCGCGNSLLGGLVAIDTGRCQYWPCAGNKGVACGGDFSLGVYVV